MTQHGAVAPEQLLIASLLERIGRQISPPRVDSLWIFPVRKVAGVHSAVIVVSAFDGTPERRRIFTARASFRSDAKGRPVFEDDLTEHGIAPTDRVRRIIDHLLRRLDRFDEPGSPADAHLAGDSERWLRLHLQLGIAPPKSTGLDLDHLPDPDTAPASVAPLDPSPELAPRRTISYQ